MDIEKVKKQKELNGVLRKVCKYSTLFENKKITISEEKTSANIETITFTFLDKGLEKKLTVDKKDIEEFLGTGTGNASNKKDTETAADQK